MDFVEGQDLAHVLARNGPLPEAQALVLIGQVCDALEYLHSQQPPIIHRDVKPQNIKVTPNGQVFLVDFGIAKLGGARFQTTPGALSVTPGFSPPEQYAMTGTDARTDIYALGATLYALLTGQVPPDSISLQSGESQLVPPRQVNADISPYMQQAILNAMEARRTDRPQTVAEFRRMLSALQVERSGTVALSAATGDRWPASEGVSLSMQPVRANTWGKPVLIGAGVVALIWVAVVVGRGMRAAPTPVPTQTVARGMETVQPTPRGTETTQPTPRPAATAVTAPPQATLQPAVVLNPPRTPEQVDAIDLTGKKVTVALWHERTVRDQALLQSMLDEFNRTNEYGITAKAEISGVTFNDVYKKVSAALSAGQPPEMSLAFPGQAATYRAAGAVIDLAPFMQSKKYGLSQAELSDYFAPFLAGDANPQFEDEQLGWPLQRSLDVLYYNADWLKQLGYDGPPKDWKQFEEMACKAVDKTKNKTGWAYHHEVANFETMILAHGGRILSKDAKSYVFNGDAGVDATRMIQRLFEKGCAVEVPTSERFGEQTRFAKGQVLFVLGASSSLTFYADAVNKGSRFKWNIALPPNNGQPVVNLYGASISVHKTTPEKELAAWLVLKFLGGTAQTARWVIQTGYLPVRKSALSQVTAAFKSDPNWGVAADMYANLFDWIPYSMSEPSAAGYDAVRTILARDIVDKVVADPNVDARALLDTSVKNANDTLKQ
jgi:multiple sugar transport system substrate-binding protein/sn-glycerol 3-phosphate transport system substrate-binding protein